MHCDETGEFVSALCDGETIPRAAAEHIGSCEKCQARMRDYVAMGVELRCVASLEIDNAVEPRVWARQQNTIAKWWQKGWGTMRIPRLAFAVMIAGIVVLGLTLVVGKVGAHADGSVVLLNTSGPDGALWSCPLSTQDTKFQACDWYGKMGSKNLAYRVRLLSREGVKVRLAIHTRTFANGENLSSFTFDSDPAEGVREVWFEPGEPLKVDVSEVGTLTLTGEWMDHVPVLGGMTKMDHLDPGPNEVRFASPLILKDKLVAADLAGVIGGIFSTDDQGSAQAIYIPGEGLFLIAQVPMKGAVEAHVAISRITFEQGGHQWEIVNGVPISRADHLWVLHKPEFKWNGAGRDRDVWTFGNMKLLQTAPGMWEPDIARN